MKLSGTELEISRVGFGCLAIGGHGWGYVDDSDSVRAIKKALELGVNFFDTADVYGFGHSEEVLASGLGDEKENVIIATKFGVTWDEFGNIGRDVSPTKIRSSLESSLRRLQLERIPLYQIHWPNGKTPIDLTMDTLFECQEAGLIDYIGCSNFPPKLLREAQKSGKIISVQGPYNVIDRRIENDVIPLCDEMGINVLSYCSLAHGLLTGKYDDDSKFAFDDQDIRKKSRYFWPDQIKKNLEAVAKLREIGDNRGKTPTQVAIRWVLDVGSIVSALTGAKTTSQVEENAGAMGWSLSQEELAYLCNDINPDNRGFL